MITTLQELGIDPNHKEKKMGRLIVGIKDQFIGETVEYQHKEYILHSCSRNYAYLLPKGKQYQVEKENYGDINTAQLLETNGVIKKVSRGHCWVPRAESLETNGVIKKVSRGHCWVPRAERKSKQQLIEEIKTSKPHLNWRHYASQSKDEGTFVEGRDAYNNIIVQIEV